MLKLTNLRRTFGRTVAVDDVSFEVRRGEIFGLLGPNGAGKTTTVNLAVGLLEPDRGRVELDGAGSPSVAAARRRIGVATQALAIYEDMSGEANLRFFGRLYRLRRGERPLYWAVEETPQTRAICRYGLAFFDHYLRGDKAAGERLSERDRALAYGVGEVSAQESFEWGEEPPQGKSPGGIRREMRRFWQERRRDAPADGSAWAGGDWVSGSLFNGPMTAKAPFVTVRDHSLRARRMRRGGSWRNVAPNTRCGMRSARGPNFTDSNNGYRVAAPAPAER